MNIFTMILSHLGFNHFTTSMEKASYEVVLKGKKQIAEETYEFVFEKPKGFHFNAGQHVRMTLLNPPQTDSKGDSRFMTLASTPQDKNLIVAMRMSDSAFKRVLGKMKNGEKILIQILLHSPHKSFVLHDNSSIPAVFLVGGIGIVPAYSIIKDATQRKLPHKMYLFYSNRRPEDAPYFEELQSLAKQNSNFKLIATMTEPKNSARSWQGETGYIDKPMLARYINDLNAPIYYIAGLSEMVHAMKKLVNNIGIDNEQIHSEDFSAMKMGLMNMTNNPNRSNNHLLYVVIISGVIAVVLIHVQIAPSFRAFSFRNLTFITIGLLSTVIILKLFILKGIFNYMHKKEVL